MPTCLIAIRNASDIIHHTYAYMPITYRFNYKRITGSTYKRLNQLNYKRLNVINYKRFNVISYKRLNVIKGDLV